MQDEYLKGAGCVRWRSDKERVRSRAGRSRQLQLISHVEMTHLLEELLGQSPH